MLLTCYQALARAGFIRYEPFTLDWPLDNEFHCWARLNAREVGHIVEIEPLIGVHAIMIERFWTAMKVGPYRARYRRDFATIATPLLSLGNQADAFVFEGNRRDKEQIRRLVALFRDRGLAFSRTMASYAALEPVLRSRARALSGNPERLATCLYLLGRAEEARAFAVAFEGERPGYFAGFSRPFLTFLDRQDKLGQA